MFEEMLSSSAEMLSCLGEAERLSEATAFTSSELDMGSKSNLTCSVSQVKEEPPLAITGEAGGKSGARTVRVVRRAQNRSYH